MKHLFSFFVLLTSPVFGSEKFPLSSGIGDPGEIVIRAGAHEVTRYEFERNFSRFVSGRKPPLVSDDPRTEKWLEGFLISNRILAEAYSLGWGEREDILADVASMAKQIVTQEHTGLLHQRLIEDSVVISEEDVRRIYELNSVERDVVCLAAEDEEALLNVFPNQRVPDRAEAFLEQLPQSMPEGVRFDRFRLSWPNYTFSPFLDTLSELDEGRVSPLLEGTGQCFLIAVVDVLSHPQEPYPEIHDQLRRSMQTAAELQFVRERRARLRSEVDVLVADGAALFVDWWKANAPGVAKIPPLDGKEFDPSIEVGSFRIDGERRAVTAGEVHSKMKTSVVRPPLRSLEDFRNVLEGIAIEEVEWKTAVELGVTKEADFVLGRKNYQNNLIYHLFEKETFGEVVEVDEARSRSRYEADTEKFAQSEYVTVDIFAFSDEAEAARSRPVIARYGVGQAEIQLKEKSRIDVLSVSGKERIYRNDDRFPPNLVHRVFRVSRGFATGPYPRGDAYIVVRKESEGGTWIPPFEQVRDVIENDLRAEQLEEMRRIFSESIQVEAEIVAPLFLDQVLIGLTGA